MLQKNSYNTSQNEPSKKWVKTHFFLVQVHFLHLPLSFPPPPGYSGDKKIHTQSRFKNSSAKTELQFSYPTMETLRLQAQLLICTTETCNRWDSRTEASLTLYHPYLPHLCQVPQWRHPPPHPSQLQASSSPQHYQFETQSEECRLCSPNQSRDCITVLTNPETPQDSTQN